MEEDGPAGPGSLGAEPEAFRPVLEVAVGGETAKGLGRSAKVVAGAGMAGRWVNRRMEVGGCMEKANPSSRVSS